jgi:hypothetical protein
VDFKLRETGSGGDLVFEGGDIKLTAEVYNQPYLGRFGGNKEASTSDQFEEDEERGDYWANYILLADEPNCQFNSKFEKSIGEIELSSSGRIKLERIADEDLNYLDGFADHESEIKITTVDRIKLTDKISRGDNKNFSYVWDEAKDEITEDDNTADII